MKYSLYGFFYLLVAAATAIAQVGVDGTILGVVADANGGMVAGARVTVTNLDTGITKTEASRDDGNFEISPLPAGRYSVTVTFAGFKTWILDSTDLTMEEYYEYQCTRGQECFGNGWEKCSSQEGLEIRSRGRGSVPTVTHRDRNSLVGPILLII